MKNINDRLPFPMMVFLYDSDWKIAEVNEKLCELLGYGKEVLLDRERLKTLVSERDLQGLAAILEHVAGIKGAEAIELRISRGDGKRRWLRLDCAFLYEEDGVCYIACAVADIQSQKETELSLKLVNEKYQMLGEITKEIPFELDVTNWTILITKRFYEMRGEKAEDRFVPFSQVLSGVHINEQEAFLKALKEATQSEKSGMVEYRVNMSTAGEAVYEWFRTYFRSIADEDGEVIRVIGRSYNVEKAKRVYDEARRDSLTMLYNKVETEKAVTDLIEENPSMLASMLVIDIDDFKEINDTFGHTYGDTVITDVASILKKHFRSDDIVGRVGGDEFLAFMKDVTPEQTVEKVKNLCKLLEKSYRGDVVSKQISISVGIAFYGKDGSTYRSLFDKADLAMYRAKLGGKSGYEIACEEDEKSLRPKQRTMDSRNDLNEQDREFLNFATSLMTHAKNIDGSLNMLLKRIADRFGLDIVALFEESLNGKTLVLTNYYSEDYDFYEKSLFPKTNPELENAAPGEMVELRRASKWSYKNGMKEWQNQSGLKTEECAMLAGKFENPGVMSGYIYYISMDGRRVWAPNEIALLSELTGAISVFVSLRTRMDESKKELRMVQRRDHLTGLYNLDTFQSRVKEILNTPVPGKIYALEYLDINNFGYVNDNFGYQVGDNALKLFAELVKSQPYYVAGCHLYSDFFVVLIEDEARESLARNINSQMKKFMRMQNQQYPSSSMSICAGAYIVEDCRMDVEHAFENANMAWKRAKHTRSREVVFFTPDMRTAKSAEQAIIGEFYDALYRGEFRLYLQPKFLLSDGTVYGAEALARWEKSRDTVLRPGAFLEPLEKIGYVTELDFFIFEELLKTVQGWMEEGMPPIVISTNFSGRNFEADAQSFLERIEAIFGKYRVPARYIEIEITEGIFIQNKIVLKECLNRLREMGFRIAIDDFGTGYSSLSVLTDIPVDVVKMDKSFIDKADSKAQRDLIAEIGKLIQIAGKDVIFEGIETEKQRDFLLKSGFVHGQGYLCNQPIPIVEFEDLYLKERL